MGAIARFFEPVFHPRRVVSLVRVRGPETARARKIEREATAEVEEVLRDDKDFRPDTPADEDEL